MTKGSINEETLKKTPVGGWTFKPTMAWANVQALAFYTFHSRVAKAGAGPSLGDESQPRNWQQKMSDCRRSAGVCRHTRLRRSALAGQHDISAVLRCTRPVLCRGGLRQLVVVVPAIDVVELHRVQHSSCVLLLCSHRDVDGHMRLHAGGLRLVGTE